MTSGSSNSRIIRLSCLMCIHKSVLHAFLARMHSYPILFVYVQAFIVGDEHTAFSALLARMENAGAEHVSVKVSGSDPTQRYVGLKSTFTRARRQPIRIRRLST